MPDPESLAKPIRQLELEEAGIRTIVWAAGYRQDFSWLKADVFDDQDQPVHERRD